MFYFPTLVTCDFMVVDRKPGDIQALTDFMLEDYKNFLKVPELGEETARFIRQEMEDTWGSEHLGVLPEEEAQHWILGVGQLISSLDYKLFLGPCSVGKSNSRWHRMLKHEHYHFLHCNALFLSPVSV